MGLSHQPVPGCSHITSHPRKATTITLQERLVQECSSNLPRPLWPVRIHHPRHMKTALARPCPALKPWSMERLLDRCLLWPLFLAVPMVQVSVPKDLGISPAIRSALEARTCVHFGSSTGCSLLDFVFSYNFFFYFSISPFASWFSVIQPHIQRRMSLMASTLLLCLF